MFVLHYAHEYYTERGGAGGGLRFPAAACAFRRRTGLFRLHLFRLRHRHATQASDVEVTSRAIRRTMTMHGMVAFVFNVTMITLTVSIAGDAIRQKQPIQPVASYD
jgi:uncharacterized membrane protein